MANFQIHFGNLNGKRMKRHMQQTLMGYLIHPLALHRQHLTAWQRQRQQDLH
jgi:hypothetical protein